MLKHPNIIEYFESFGEMNSINIVMEYATGGNLYDFLQARGENNYLMEEVILNKLKLNFNLILDIKL